MLKMILDFLTLGLIVGALPNTISNGSAVDAVPVMTDFNWLVSQVNANAAAASDLAATNAAISAVTSKFDISNTYVPAWAATSGTQPAIGNGSILGEYTRNGNSVQVKIAIVFGTTTTFGNAGTWNFGLPLPYAGTLENDSFAKYAQLGGNDVFLYSKILAANPSIFTLRNTTNALSFSTVAWGNGDAINATITYQIAN